MTNEEMIAYLEQLARDIQKVRSIFFECNEDGSGTDKEFLERMGASFSRWLYGEDNILPKIYEVIASGKPDKQFIINVSYIAQSNPSLMVEGAVSKRHDPDVMEVIKGGV